MKHNFEKDYPFVYKWTQLSTGKWYIGSRTAKMCHPNDGYLCSSKIVKPLIKAYPNDWYRQILFMGTGGECRQKEVAYLVGLDATTNPMSFNMHNGDGKFSRAGVPVTQRQREAAREVGLARKGRPATSAQIEGCRKGGLARKGKPATSAQIEARRKGGLASKGTVATFSLTTHEIKRIPKEEFDANKGTLYVGHTHTLAKAWKSSEI